MLEKNNKDNNPDLSEFIQKEIDTMEIFLVSKAEKAAITIDEYIKTRLKQGASIDSIEKDLLTDLENSGRIFGEFRNAIRATTTGTINRSRDNAIFANLGIDAPYRWVAVLINTCPDCLDRHNKVQPWAMWEIQGLPRTGATVCKENCQCVLVPSFTVEIDPIMRGK